MKLTAATSGGKKKKGSDKGLNSAHILKRLHSHTHTPFVSLIPKLGPLFDTGNDEIIFCRVSHVI